jgi:hypothetical protein
MQIVVRHTPADARSSGPVHDLVATIGTTAKVLAGGS